ncbi:hypothetical protein KM043_014050 [Ampulex compressa]|nr:hypothetical protein KM043_014050 [Ampulex compressa]
MELPVHRFREAICGYDDLDTMVCCNVDDNWSRPTFTGGRELPPLLSAPNSKECGKSLISSNVATVGTYPFVVRIGFIGTTGEIKYCCNGVIINERTILATASCALARSEKYKLYTVLVGEFNTDTDPDCNSLFCGHTARNYNISYVVKHPNYQSETFANNVALLRLERPIEFTIAAQPVCFGPKDWTMNTRMCPILVGWGKFNGQREKAAKQQSQTMTILHEQECSDYYGRDLSVEMCAIGEQTPCTGYNGASLVYEHNNRYFLLGLLSYGFNCETATNFPSVFVNAQKYTRWIIENS